jgi:hypothetical protein
MSDIILWQCAGRRWRLACGLRRSSCEVVRLSMIRILAVLGFAAVMANAPVQADPAAQRVLDRMAANVPMTLRVRTVSMTNYYADGESTQLKGVLYLMREPASSGTPLLRAMLRVSVPEDLAGSAYLLRAREQNRGDAMWMYLPSVGSVRRVSDDPDSGPLLGTAFSYADFRHLHNSFDEAISTYEGEAHIDHRKVDVLLLRPRSEAAADDTQVRIWVDRLTAIALRSEFYRGEVLSKRLGTSPVSLRQSGPYWYLTQAEMRDLRNGSRTVLRMGDVTESKRAPEPYFNPLSFYRAR